MGSQWPRNSMAEFSTLVSAVHRIYQDMGGDYGEGTAPELMQVAAAVRSSNADELRAAADRTDVVVRILSEAIKAELRRRAEQ